MATSLSTSRHQAGRDNVTILLIHTDELIVYVTRGIGRAVMFEASPSVN